MALDSGLRLAKYWIHGTYIPMLFRCQRPNAYRDRIAGLGIEVKGIVRTYAFDKPGPVVGLRPPLIPRRRYAMYKNLSIAVLLVAFGLVAARSTGSPAPTPSSPVIVKKVILANQTAPIPTTTLFTPASNGLFRVSIYMTQVVPTQRNNGYWLYNLDWTDDAGPESGATQPIMQMYDGQMPPQAWGTFDTSPGNVVILEGVAGKPVTFSISLSGTTSGGTYSAYFTVERLI
jgi:hypothetical protein